MRNNSDCHKCSTPRNQSDAMGDGSMEWEFEEGGEGEENEEKKKRN